MIDLYSKQPSLSELLERNAGNNFVAVGRRGVSKDGTPAGSIDPLDRIGGLSRRCRAV